MIIWINFYLRSNPLGMFKQAFLGARLFLQGRISLTKDGIKRKDELARLLETVKDEHMMKPKKKAHAHGEAA